MWHKAAERACLLKKQLKQVPQLKKLNLPEKSQNQLRIAKKQFKWQKSADRSIKCTQNELGKIAEKAEKSKYQHKKKLEKTKVSKIRFKNKLNQNTKCEKFKNV